MRRTQIEFDQYISPDGITYDLDGSVDRAIVTSLDGQGMPPIEYITQRGPLQHGETIIAYRLQPRVVQMIFRQNACNRQGYWDNRAELLNQLRPNRSVSGTVPLPGQLRKIQPNNTVRDLDVVIESGPVFESNGADWDEWSFQEGLRFVAHDPTFYDPTAVVVDASPPAITELSVPISVPLHFGAGTATVLTNQVYGGTWLAFPVITLTGPLEAAVITNLTTDEEIIFAKVLDGGEVVTIDLRFGYKTVKDANGVNLLGFVTGDLGSFHIEPDPVAPGGVNNLSFYIASPAATGAVQMQYNTRYIGI